MTKPIRLHPENPKLFEFRGKPLVLVTATEHYGAVMNRPFLFEKYLADAAKKKITLTRLFTLFRELQLANNPYSTCKPESPDYVAPFKRVGPGKALDGEPQYDLDVWNPEFFERLHGFLSLASKYRIIVEVTLFSNTYCDEVWNLNPLHPKNNINGLKDIKWAEYITCRHPELFKRQKAYLHKILLETNRYDNIIYELCNEPGGGFNLPESPSVEEVNAWLKTVAREIRRTEAGLKNKHLISGQEAFVYFPWEQPTTRSFRDFPVDIVNMHSSHLWSNTSYDGKSYDHGEFMKKKLRLERIRDYCLDTYPEKKPLNFDEDNSASCYKDLPAWLIHRKRAWAALFGGAHYDYIDFSIVNYRETGSPEAQKYIRTWMKHLSEYIHSIDLVNARPVPQIVKKYPSPTLPFVLAVEGKDYNIYLVDKRELEEKGYGKPLCGSITCELPAGVYELAFYSPVTGRYSTRRTLTGSRETRIKLPEFTHDIVLRLRKKK